MKNRKGFTLVELLVVIVILGIITGLSIPLIRNLSASMEKKKYTTYNETLLSGAKLYNDSYSEDLFGHNENGCAYVTYSQLEDRNLLKDIEISDVSCNSDSTFVRILKIGDKYAYSPFLGCGKEKNGKAGSIDTTLPVANQENVMKAEYCTGTEENNLEISALIGSDAASMNKKRKKTKLTITSATGINPRISLAVKWSTNKTDHEGSFEKVDFKVPGDQKEKMLGGEIISTKSGELLTPAGITGEVYLIVRVDQLQDLYGSKWKNPEGTGSKYVSFGPFVIDNEPPTVPVITAYVKTKSANISSGGSLPKINSNTWSNKWELIVPKSTDNSGGAITYYYTTSGTATESNKVASYKNINAEGVTNIKYKACDVAGNCSAYSSNFVVKLDRTKPTCGTATNASTTWTKNDRTIKQACSDSLSGCVKASYDKTYNTTTKTDSASIKDKAGNSNTCNYNVYVDKTKPTKPTIDNPSGEKWKNANFSLTLKSNDAHSGIKHYQYTYAANATATGSDNTKQWVTYSNSNKTTFTTTAFSAERNGYVYVRSCDVAGNCSDKNQTYIRIDKTPPTCTNSGGNSNWVNTNITITGACSDNASGCKANVVKTYSTNTNTNTASPGNVFDNAGNKGTCPGNQPVHIDKTPPTCPSVTATAGGSNYTSGATTCSNVVVTGNCSDTGGSGCKGNPTTTVTSTQSVTLTVQDNAGNSTNCNAFAVKRGTSVADSSCGCKTYKTCQNSACGTTTTSHTYAAFDAYASSNCSQKHPTAFGYVGYTNYVCHYYDGDFIPKTYDCNPGCYYKVTRSTTTTNSCRTSACGCETYNTCCR